MSWTRLADKCPEGDCATVYLTEHGTVAVQGPVLPPADGVRPSPDEMIVEIPLTLLQEAARATR